jgi:DNA-binding NtrC family response regulator
MAYPSELIRKFPELFQFSQLVAGHYLVVVLDETGRIHARDRGKDHRYAAVVAAIEGRQAGEIFQLPKHRTLSEIFKLRHGAREVSFPARPELGVMASEGYSSALPLATLQVIPLNSSHWLGIIQFHHLFPNFPVNHRPLEVFCDLKGHVKGYSDDFEAHLGLSRDAILGRPVRDFLDGINLNTLPGPARLPGKGAGAEWILEARPLGTSVNRSWHAPAEGELQLLELPAPLHLRTSDYKAEISVTCHEGCPPGLLLPGDAKAPEYPDRRGYHFVVRRLSDEWAQLAIKRVGALLASSPISWSALNGRLTLTVMKIGKYLRFSLGGQPPLDFLDDDVLEPEGAAPLVLSLAPGSRVTLHDVKIHTLPRRIVGMDETAKPVRFKNRPGALYHVRRSTVFYLEPLLVFTLVNVSDYLGLLRRYGQLAEEKERMEKEAKNAYEGTGFLGQSPAVRRIMDSLPKVADVPMTLLIEGETGTGKEVLAHAIHRFSNRREKPFIKVDCTTLPPALMESELFGHEKGAFTGALSRRIGRFEQAQGGTLFLDEVSTLSRDIQAKLLDFMQTSEVVRVGGNERIRVDAKIIAASNRPLEAMVKEGAFREDLFYRINQLRLHLPPLRERREDISLLADHFIRLANAFCNKNVKAADPDALEILENRNWPGNARELRNVIFHAVVYAAGDTLTASDLLASQEPPEGKRGRRPYKKLTLSEVETALQRHKGNLAGAARYLGVPRTTLYRILGRTGRPRPLKQ